MRKSFPGQIAKYNRQPDMGQTHERLNGWSLIRYMYVVKLCLNNSHVVNKIMCSFYVPAIINVATIFLST